MRSAPLAGLLVLVICVSIGCNRNAYFAQRPFGQPDGQPADAHTAQLQELTRRINQLDVDNRDLHARLAQRDQLIRQKDQLYQATQKQLAEMARQQTEIVNQRNDFEQKLASLKTSTQHRGGATITANNSLQNSLKVIDIPGVDVRQDGSVVRIELLSDRVFVQNSSQMRQEAIAVLDQVAVAVGQNYPRNRVGVEGHTDNSTLPGLGTNHHLLANNQAKAVFDQLIRSGRIQPNRMFVVSHGANHPRFSNGEPAGRARNRRVELVIYPDTIQ